MAYPVQKTRWPRPWQVRRWKRFLVDEFAQRSSDPFDLDSALLSTIPVRGNRITAADIPDGDVIIATWWETREWIESFPSSKGIKVHFIRGHEVYSGAGQRIEDVYRLPGLKLVISNWLRSVMAEKYGDASAVLVPNGLDWSMIDSSPRQFARLPVVGMQYGRPKWKGADTAFAALRRVQASVPELRVIAYGRHALSRRPIPPQNLEYLVRPPRETIGEIYRRCQCWLLPSTTEGFGMPGLEASASGTPVVATRCGGPADYLRDAETGFFVGVGEVEEMADAVLRVLKLEEASWLAMSRAGQQVAKSFDWDRSAMELERVLISACEGAPAQPLA